MNNVMVYFNCWICFFCQSQKNTNINLNNRSLTIRHDNTVLISFLLLLKYSLTLLRISVLLDCFYIIFACIKSLLPPTILFCLILCYSTLLSEPCTILLHSYHRNDSIYAHCDIVIPFDVTYCLYFL